MFALQLLAKPALEKVHHAIPYLVEIILGLKLAMPLLRLGVAVMKQQDLGETYK